MKTFVLMTRLSPKDCSLVEVGSKLRDSTDGPRSWIETIKKTCPEVKFIGHYALMGHWDFMDIYQAPDEKVAAKVSLITRKYVSAEVESWLAIPYEHIEEITNEIK